MTHWVRWAEKMWKVQRPQMFNRCTWSRRKEDYACFSGKAYKENRRREMPLLQLTEIRITHVVNFSCCSIAPRWICCFPDSVESILFSLCSIVCCSDSVYAPLACFSTWFSTVQIFLCTCMCEAVTDFIISCIYVISCISAVSQVL